MKKGWKIALISLGSLLGLVIVVVAIVLWLVFTPSQLTKIVNSLAGKYVMADTRFGKVNLTLFKTFPDAGLTIDDVYVINPVEGAPCDTVAYIGNLTVGLDAKKYLKEKEIVVHKVMLDRVNACLFVNREGVSNYDIFPHSDKEKDTTKSPFSLDSLPNIDLKKVKVSDANATYSNLKNNIAATIDDLGICVKGALESGLLDATVNLGSERIALTTKDSLGGEKMNVLLQDLNIKLRGNGNTDSVAGQLKLKVKKGDFVNGGTDMVNETLANSKHDLLSLDMPFSANLHQMTVHLEESTLKLDDYGLTLRGDVGLQPLDVDMELATTDYWQVAPLLDIVPPQYVTFRKGMDVDAKIQLHATAIGTLTDSTMPLVNAHVTLADGRFYYPKSLPYKITRINGAMSTKLDLSKDGKSDVTIQSLKAHTRSSDVYIKGHVDDLLGDMHIDASVQGSLPLDDLKPLLPDTLPLTATGKADIDLHANLLMSYLQKKSYDKIRANGTIKLNKLDVLYDSIHATTPDLDIAIQLPAKRFQDKMLETHLKSSTIQLAMNGITAQVKSPNISVGVNDITREQIAAAFDISLEKTLANLDSNTIDLSALSLSGSIKMDSTKDNILRKYNPNLDVDLRRTRVTSPMLGEELYINNLDFHYSPELCDIADADIKLGNSDLQLYGSVQNLEPWLSHEKMLTGDLNLTSHYTDVDQLMDMFSGMGSDKDSIEKMREEDKVEKDANPFIVPKDVDFTLHTHLQRSLAFGNDLGDVAGSVTVKDGVAVLDQIGFVCKAATMQLTALYKSPRPNNLFAAIDFHLLDIQIDELLDMIPTVDTLVPMLAAFNGNANFHLAGESFLFATYKPKMSTLLGSAAISGKDLVVMDNNSIAQIAKLMQFKSWKDKDNKIKIDSLSVEMTCLRKEIEVFPFLLNIGGYQLCASGKHTLDNQCGYHVELLKNPLMAKVGVDVTGTLKNPKISLGQVRYADLYKPSKQGVMEKETLKMKQMVREALEKNVR